jgi:hypothetical protein
MKTGAIAVAVIFSMALFVGCDSRASDRHETPGEAAGRAAYNVEKESKKAAKELSKDLKTFGHDARQGFESEKRKDEAGKKVREPEASPSK